MNNILLSKVFACTALFIFLSASFFWWGVVKPQKPGVLKSPSTEGVRWIPFRNGLNSKIQTTSWSPALFSLPSAVNFSAKLYIQPKGAAPVLENKENLELLYTERGLRNKPRGWFMPREDIKKLASTHYRARGVKLENPNPFGQVKNKEAQWKIFPLSEISDLELGILYKLFPPLEGDQSKISIQVECEIDEDGYVTHVFYRGDERARKVMAGIIKSIYAETFIARGVARVIHVRMEYLPGRG